MTGRRVLLAEGRPIRGRRLAQAMAERGAVEIETIAHTLMEAYDRTETLAPDAVAISIDMARRPEFPMYRALLEAMRMRYCIYGAAMPDDMAKLRGAPFAPLGDDMDIAAIVARLGGKGTADGAVDVAQRPAPAPVMPLVVIGASTGGIEAIETVLAGFPAECPPTLIVQHIRGEFSGSVAARFNRACPAMVREARDGALLHPGSVQLAPGNDHHLEISGRQGLRCRLRPAPPVSGHRPSIDVLFRSAAACALPVIGVLLTGMGRDGAEGLLAIRRAGGTTLAQDRDSCVVFGMPRVASEIGAVERALPPRQMAAAILAAAAEPRRKRCEEETR
ncbi:MAG: chemotaxis protein CheB [Pararhodobacter sp.]|nr:chemotaxis protein CheB [Pararhodobacter sp.]